MKKRMHWIWVGLIMAGFMFSGMKAQAENMIQVKGSDSEVNLVQRLAEVFMEKHPDVNIAVTGGGSGAGIAALINKTTDIANSSREMQDKEIEAAKKAGVQPFRVVFATDAISIIVNPTNPISKLTVEQLGKIYKGQISNWKDVGGKDIINTVRAIRRGESVLHPVIARKVMDRFFHTTNGKKPPEKVLGDRELEVLQLASKALSNQEMADHLGLSLHTIEAHMRHIFSKLHVGSRTEAVLYALKQGWITIDDMPET